MLNYRNTGSLTRVFTQCSVISCGCKIYLIMQNKQVSNPETTNKLSYVIYSSVVLILPENTRTITAEVNVHTLPESDT